MNPTKCILSMAAIVAIGLTSVFADTLAYTEGGDNPTDTGGTGLVGFNFTVTSSIDVTQLGFFGSSIGGGDTPWVALYNVTSSTELASITTFAPLNGWQYIALDSAVTLNPGDTYQIAATAYWSPKYEDMTGFTFGSEIVPASVSGSSFTIPSGWSGWGAPAMATNGYASMPNITANFQYIAAAIPEPSSYAAIFGLATLGFVALRRRRS